MSSPIWDRVYRLEVGDNAEILTIDGFEGEPAQITFNVAAYADHYVQDAEINIFGLSRENREKLYAQYTQVKLTAGYRTRFAEIFSGNIINVAIGRDGAETFVTLYCRSVGVIWANAFINQSWGNGTPAKEIIDDVARTFGYPVTYIGDFSDLPNAINGMTYSMDSKAAMRALGRNYSFSWTIVDGELLITRLGAGRVGPDTIFKVSADSGMVGSPRITQYGLDVTMRMNTAIRMYSDIEVENATGELVLSGTNLARLPDTIGVGRYNVRWLTHIGDFYGDSWDTIVGGWSPRVGQLPRTGQY